MGESSHDHKHEHEHEHEHDHKHEHKHEHEHDHKHEHDHDHEPKDKKAKLDTDDKNDAHDHSHSHAHGEDCHECGPKVLEADSMSEEPVPEWKKNALKEQLDPSAAPFGGNWTLETSVSATKDAAPKSIPSHAHDHGHSHEHMDHPGNYSERPTGFMNSTERDYKERAFTVGLGGPVGSGKTALMLALCHKLRDQMSVGAVTNDIFTREDGEFLTRHEALPKERIRAVETGGCPHAAIREDISANLHACEVLTASFTPLDIILLESGGDNLAANFSPELADFTIYVIDVAGGDKVPRKGGPGVTQSDVLVINKTDLAEAVGASLDVMKRDSKKMRGDGPTVFAQAKEGLGKGVDEITKLVLDSWKEATKPKH